MSFEIFPLLQYLKKKVPLTKRVKEEKKANWCANSFSPNKYFTWVVVRTKLKSEYNSKKARAASPRK